MTTQHQGRSDATKIPDLGPLNSELRDLVLGAITNSVIVADATAPDLPILWVNSAFERTTGYQAEEVLGRNCRFLQGPGTDRSAVGAMRRAIEEERGCTLTLLNYRKDGAPFWQELSLAPIRDDSGRLTHYVGVQTDLTALRRAEERSRSEVEARQRAAEEAERFAQEALRLTEAAKRLAENAQHLAEERLHLAEERRSLAEEARRTAERGRVLAESAIHLRNEVLATVTHDVRSPLTGLRGRLDLMRARLAAGQPLDSEWSRRQLEAMGGAANRIAGTLEEMTDVAQLWVGQQLVLHFEPLDLDAVIREAVASEGARWAADGASLPKDGIGIELPDDFRVNGDRLRLTRVFENLIGNALKYGEGKAIRIRGTIEGDKVVVTVNDNGVGVPAVEVPHIFTRFFRATTARGVAGTGIGLAGAKAIVEQHGGTVALESIEGQGTTVTVTLPRPQARREHTDGHQ